jgi:ribonuclease HII
MDRFHYEKSLWAQGYNRIMGLDEVGRGCLCGPVVAAGVILEPHTHLSNEVADSKTLEEKDRVRLAAEIKEKASFWTIQQCSAKEIDDINILKASIKAMIRCSEANGAEPDYLLVDGNMFSSTVIPYSCIVKGDDKSVSIAAASILAKVHRDELMKELHEEYPVYGWKTNVGYGTREHFEGLEKHGYTEHHRLSFSLRTTKVFERSE